MNTDNLFELIKELNSQPVKFRLKLKNKDKNLTWEDWIINPTGNYIETGQTGPNIINKIEYIEINPIEEKNIGKLVPKKMINHSLEIIKIIESKNINFKQCENTIKIEIKVEE
ncbi:DUF6678 family protein [Chryseobacterium shigense]|uniref:Uncharacterized protein n=1 Tax=Chryseobacterium shigense TaxID=297244 RepID=A0A841NAQ3_9FLAO|nr:DUF6678 family protein [Chryseobacterium shigense]MBB6372113.1 hypothetical protein [Chryseobacterium shigense]